MPSIAEHVADLNAAFETYIAELREFPQSAWERKPAAGGEGEEAWSARQVAEHLAGASTFFGAGIAMFVGVPGPQREPATFASVAEAVAGTPGAHEKLMDVVRAVPEDKLDMEIEAPRLGKHTVSGFMGIAAYHLRDHAGQLKALRGS